MLLATVSSGAYKFVKTLHILTAIVGFGAIFLNGLYQSRARKAIGRDGGVALVEANAFVSWKVAEYIIYAVFILGLILVPMSSKVYQFKQGWLGAAMGLYIVGLALAHAVLRPADKRMRAIQAELNSGAAPAPSTAPPAQVAEYDKLYQRAAVAAGVLDVLVVVIVFLMVFKPGA